jgi:Methyltransferase domain
MSSRRGIRATYAARVARAIYRDPYEAEERILDRIDEWREKRRALPTPSPNDAWEQDLHTMLGARWPCPEAEKFSRIWRDTVCRVEARGITVGRGAFGGWDDADPALGRAAWCITRHAHPRTVVETGVARGFTTSVILEALRRNRQGRLFSIDQPPLVEVDLATETGAAVRDELRSSWMLVRGSSRRCLGGLLAQLECVDFFVHDSMHTTRNVLFELRTVWPVLLAGGLLLVDDIERNGAFSLFSADFDHPVRRIIIPADDGRALIGVLQKQHDP